MAGDPAHAQRNVGRSHGYVAVADDGPCGTVETPLFPPEGGEPDFLIVRVGGPPRTRRPIVTVALVDRVDSQLERVYLRATGREIAALPEHLPLSI